MCRAFFIATFVIAVVVSVAPAAASGTYEIYNFQSNQCLQPVNGPTGQGAAIVQELCNGGAAQQRVEVSAGRGIFHYVDARGAATNGIPVQQWTCNKISNENWQPGEDIADNIPPLVSRVSGTNSYCLDIPGAQQTAGLAMRIYRCNGAEARQWWIAPSPLKKTITKGIE